MLLGNEIYNLKIWRGEMGNMSHSVRPAGAVGPLSMCMAYLDHFPCDGAQEHDFMCIVSSAVLICQLALLKGTTEEIPAGCWLRHQSESM
jgi:hypothetical protein